MTYRLYGAPAPLPAESPNSWLQRIAHRYDLCFADLQDALGARWAKDADLEISREGYGAMARVCGRPVAETALMYSVFCVGRGADVSLWDPKGRPLYRFCLGCFQDDAVPYLRIEWRLSPWTVCPRHLCRLRAGCAGCGKPWRMEAAVLRERSSKARTLAHCQWCGLDQRTIDWGSPSPKLAGAAALGRAVVSALANGHAVVTRGLWTNRVNVSFLLLNLDRVKVGSGEEYVNLVMDQTATIGIERQLALKRAGLDAELRGRTRVLYDRFRLGVKDGARAYKPVPQSAEGLVECATALMPAGRRAAVDRCEDPDLGSPTPTPWPRAGEPGRGGR